MNDQHSTVATSHLAGVEPWPEGVCLDPRLWRRADPPPGCAAFLTGSGASVFKVPKPLDLLPSPDAYQSVPRCLQHTEWCRRRLVQPDGTSWHWAYFVNDKAEHESEAERLAATEHEWALQRRTARLLWGL